MTYQSIRAGFFTWPSARSDESRLKRSVASADSEHRIAGCDRRDQTGGIVIGGVEALAADLLDVIEQVLGVSASHIAGGSGGGAGAATGGAACGGAGIAGDRRSGLSGRGLRGRGRSAAGATGRAWRQQRARLAAKIATADVASRI